MTRKFMILSAAVIALALVTACRPPAPPPGTQIVLLGESFATGAEAVREANNAIANASGAGCKAISVGGYAAAGEGQLIGIPVLVDCPRGTTLLPNGTPGTPAP